MNDSCDGAESGCVGLLGLMLAAASALGGFGALCEGSGAGFVVALLVFSVGVVLLLIALDGLHGGRRRRGPPHAAIPLPGLASNAPGASDTPWGGGSPRLSLCIEARTSTGSLLLAVCAGVGATMVALNAMLGRAEGSDALAIVGIAVFLPVAFAPFSALRDDGGDRAVNVASVIAAVGIAGNMGLPITIWLASPPGRHLTPTPFGALPNAAFLWSPFAGAGGAWFLAGLGTLLVLRASREGGLPGHSRDMREAAAWWMNGVPLISLLAYQLAIRR